MKSESIKNLTAALCKVQAEIKDAPTDAENPHFRSKYTSLSGVLSTIRKPLAAQGLAITQTLDVTDSGLPTLVTTLLHVSGEWIDGRMLLNPVKNDPQGLKSAVTYARRTSLTAITGIAEDDDDANLASAHTVIKQPPTAIRVSPIKPLNVGAQPSGFIIPFGKYQGQDINSVSLSDLKNYVEYLQNTAQKDGKPLNKNALQLANMYADRVRKEIGHSSVKGDNLQAHAQEDIPF